MFDNHTIKKTSNSVSDIEIIRQIGVKNLNSITPDLHELTEEELSQFSGGVTQGKTRRALGSVTPIEEIGF